MIEDASAADDLLNKMCDFRPTPRRHTSGFEVIGKKLGEACAAPIELIENRNGVESRGLFVTQIVLPASISLLLETDPLSSAVSLRAGVPRFQRSLHRIGRSQRIS